MKVANMKVANMKVADMKIVAVGMLDFEVFGRDTFFVQTGADEVELYEAFTDGRVKKLIDAPAPGRFVAASVEKFANMYRCEAPVTIADVRELVRHIGQFEITSDTACRALRPRS